MHVIHIRKRSPAGGGGALKKKWISSLSEGTIGKMRTRERNEKRGQGSVPEHENGAKKSIWRLVSEKERAEGKMRRSERIFNEGFGEGTMEGIRGNSSAQEVERIDRNRQKEMIANQALGRSRSHKYRPRYEKRPKAGLEAGESMATKKRAPTANQQGEKTMMAQREGEIPRDQPRLTLIGAQKVQEIGEYNRRFTELRERGRENSAQNKRRVIDQWKNRAQEWEGGGMRGVRRQKREIAIIVCSRSRTDIL